MIEVFNIGVGEVVAQFLVAIDAGSKVGYASDFLIEYVVRKAVLRDSVAQPSTGFGVGFKNIYLMTFALKPLCSRKATRTCSDHGNVFTC